MTRPLTVVALGLAAGFLGSGVAAMQNPFRVDLRSVSVACEGADASQWCDVAASVIENDVDVAVAVVDMTALPLNPSGGPAVNDAWLTIRILSQGSGRLVGLEWGSAMRMAGVGTGEAEVRLADSAGMDDAAVWRDILSATPFVQRKP